MSDSSFHTFAVVESAHLSMISPVHVENLETVDVQQTNYCFPGGILQIIYTDMISAFQTYMENLLWMVLCSQTSQEKLKLICWCYFTQMCRFQNWMFFRTHSQSNACLRLAKISLPRFSPHS